MSAGAVVRPEFEFKPYSIVNACRGSTLHASDRLILITMAFNSERNGRLAGICKESQAELAAQTGLTDRTIRTRLAALVASGTLELVSAEHNRTTVYRLSAATIPQREAPAVGPTLNVRTAETTSGETGNDFRIDRKRLPVKAEMTSYDLVDRSSPVDLDPPPPYPPPVGGGLRGRNRREPTPDELERAVELLVAFLEEGRGVDARTWADAANGDGDLAKQCRRALIKRRNGFPSSIRSGRMLEPVLVEAARRHAARPARVDLVDELVDQVDDRYARVHARWAALDRAGDRVGAARAWAALERVARGDDDEGLDDELDALDALDPLDAGDDEDLDGLDALIRRAPRFRDEPTLPGEP